MDIGKGWKGLNVSGPTDPKRLLAPHARNEKGTFIYERARDTRLPPDEFAKMNTFPRFMKVSIVRCWETWPLVGFLGIWLVGTTFVAYKTFSKFEIWLDRSKKLPPWDWSRCRDNYYKIHQKFYFVGGEKEKAVKHARLPILETLQDEMLEAAKQRGTR